MWLSAVFVIAAWFVQGAVVVCVFVKNWGRITHINILIKSFHCWGSFCQSGC